MTTEALREMPLRKGEGEGESEEEEGEVYLLAVDEDVLSSRERLFDPCASIVEVGL